MRESRAGDISLKFHPLFHALEGFFRDRRMGEFLEWEFRFFRRLPRRERRLYLDFCFSLEPGLKREKLREAGNPVLCLKAPGGDLVIRLILPVPGRSRRSGNFMEGRFLTREGFSAEFALSGPDAECPGLDLLSPLGARGFFPLPQGNRRYYAGPAK